MRWLFGASYIYIYIYVRLFRWNDLSANVIMGRLRDAEPIDAAAAALWQLQQLLDENETSAWPATMIVTIVLLNGQI